MPRPTVSVKSNWIYPAIVVLTIYYLSAHDATPSTHFPVPPPGKFNFAAQSHLDPEYQPPHILLSLPVGVEPAISGRDVTFGDFLRQRIKLTPNTVIWLTIADGVYAKTAVRHLALFMDTMNHNKPTEEREELVVLCLDEECVAECAKYGEFAYAGFIYDPKKTLFPMGEVMSGAVWLKINGLIDALEAGYACVFVDDDVFLRRDPRPYFKPLTDTSWDLQIQEESHNRNVNVGFFFQRASLVSVTFWKEVLLAMRQGTSTAPAWDQTIVNNLLRSKEARHNPTSLVPLSKFVGPTGLKVTVLNAQYFWGFHLGWLFIQETTLLHMSCADDVFHKFYLAATYGAWRDVDQYYTKPRRILIAPDLVGTEEELLTTMKLVIAVARITRRDILLPIRGVYIEKTSRMERLLHRRAIWSLFPLREIEEKFQVTILEPNYLEHASLYAGGDSLAELQTDTEFDLRRQKSFSGLIGELEGLMFQDARVVRLSTDEGPAGSWSSYGSWHFPEELETLETCKRIGEVSGCGTLCRRA